MPDLEERPSLTLRLERWAVRSLERRYTLTLLTCILAQSAIALALDYRPLRIAPTLSRQLLFLDVRDYYVHTGRVVAGEVPYRDFTIEYPPLGLATFLVPRMLSSSLEQFELLLSLEMLAFNAAAVVLAARWTASRQGIGRVPRFLAWYTAFFVLCLPMAMAKFDLAVGFVAFASAYLLLSRRPVAGGAMTAASVLMKILPGVAAAPMFYRELTQLPRSRPRAIISAALCFAVGVGAWLALGGVDGVRRTFRYHGERSLENESLYAGILMLAGQVGGWKVETDINHSATHLMSPLAMRLASLAILVQLASMVLAVAAYARSGMRDGLRYSTACLVGFVAFGKVLSPQYMLWLIPFFACLGGRTGGRAKVAFLIICGLTELIFPFVFWWMTRPGLRGMVWYGILTARNLALVAAYLLLVFGPQGPADPLESPASDGGKGAGVIA